MTYQDWLLILAATQVGDLLTTLKIVALGGHEANPLMRKLMQLTSPAVAMVAKGVALVALATYFGPPFAPYAAAVTAGFVLWNLTVINRLKGKP